MAPTRAVRAVRLLLLLDTPYYFGRLNRKVGIHPINRERHLFGEFHHLYYKLSFVFHNGGLDWISEISISATPSSVELILTSGRWYDAKKSIRFVFVAVAGNHRNASQLVASPRWSLSLWMLGFNNTRLFNRSSHRYRDATLVALTLNSP